LPQFYEISRSASSLNAYEKAEAQIVAERALIVWNQHPRISSKIGDGIAASHRFAIAQSRFSTAYKRPVSLT